MGENIDTAQLIALPVNEKLELIELLWDSIERARDAVALPGWHLEEIDQRLKAHEADPAGGAPWPDARDRILKRLER